MSERNVESVAVSRNARTRAKQNAQKGGFFEIKRRIFAKWGATFLLLATFFTGWAMAAAPVVRPMGIDKLGREGIGRRGVEVKRINVRVDATAGVQALSGAHVAEGDPIGIDPDAQ